MSSTREVQLSINYLLLLVIFVNTIIPFVWSRHLLVSISPEQLSLIYQSLIFMYLGLSVLLLVTFLVKSPTERTGFIAKGNSKVPDVLAIVGNVIFLFGYFPIAIL